MTTKATRVLEQVYGQSWAITPEGLMTVIRVAEREGDVEAVLSKRGDLLENTQRVEMIGSAAVIPVRGPIFRYANLFTAISGATSISTLATDFRVALENPEVSAVVLDIDSPGGQVTGINEFAEMIFQAREVKPVIAYVGGAGASAAYWIASAASEIMADATSSLGSIGVVIGYRKSDDDVIEIVSTASPNKRPDLETDEGRAVVLQTADALADVFIRAVARNRGVNGEIVRSDFGRGGVLVGRAAVEAGLADRLGSLEEVLAQINSNNNLQQGGKTMATKKEGKEDTGATPAITAEAIRAERPEIAAELRKEGADAERARIKGVLSLDMPGHADLLYSLAFDGESTEEQAALRLVQVEKERRKNVASALTEDAGQLPDLDTGIGAGDDGKAEEDAAVAAIAEAGSEA